MRSNPSHALGQDEVKCKILWPGLGFASTVSGLS